MVMQWYRKHMLLYSLLAVFAVLLLIIIANVLIIRFSGSPVPVPEIPREPQKIGEGRPLKYSILGDSTAVGQGGDYNQGIATLTAKHISNKGYKVSYQNFAISGATVNDVLTKQLDKVLSEKPDVVLLSIGANDVTGFTKLHKVKLDMSTIVKKLKSKNSDVKIIITGSPQMGSVPRFPWPANVIAKIRTSKINQVFGEVSSDPAVTFARIADETGPTFYKHPEYFADDKFHPMTVGYLVWIPVLNKAVDKAL